eukprot:c46064_g1_i1 orf=58-243(+)
MACTFSNAVASIAATVSPSAKNPSCHTPGMVRPVKVLSAASGNGAQQGGGEPLQQRQSLQQ